MRSKWKKEHHNYKTYFDSKYDNHIALSYGTIFNHEMQLFSFFNRKVKIAKAKSWLELLTNRSVADTLVNYAVEHNIVKEKKLIIADFIVYFKRKYVAIWT